MRVANLVLVLLAFSSLAWSPAMSSDVFHVREHTGLTASPPQDSLPKGLGWHELRNTTISPFCPRNLPYFPAIQGGGCRGTIEAWNSGFYDSRRHRLILYGGGHVDYGGNEFYAIQLDGNPAYALRLSDPSPCSNCACNASRSLGATSDDGSPRSNHTYDTMVYAPPEDKLIKIGVTATYCSSGGDQHIWTLPLASLSGAGHTLGSPPWAKFSAGPFANSSPGAGTGDFDPNTGLIFFSNANIYSGFYALNPSSTTTESSVPPGSVIQINGTSAGCYDCTSVVDPLERRLFQFGDSSIPSPFQSWGIDPNNKSTYGQPVRLGTPTSCPKLPNAPGADWDPIAQMFVIWPSNGNPSTTQLYAFNPSDSSRTYGAVTVPARGCTALNPPGGGPPNAPTGNGTFKRFRYVGYCDCFVLLNAWGQNAFIVRTR